MTNETEVSFGEKPVGGAQVWQMIDTMYNHSTKFPTRLVDVKKIFVGETATSSGYI